MMYFLRLLNCRFLCFPLENCLLNQVCPVESPIAWVLLVASFRCHLTFLLFLVFPIIESGDWIKLRLIFLLVREREDCCIDDYLFFQGGTQCLFCFEASSCWCVDSGSQPGDICPCLKAFLVVTALGVGRLLQTPVGRGQGH